MMACLRESDLQGYLEESGASPLRRMVESHLVSCAQCRTAFDRVVATHQRVNAWLSELASPADEVAVDVRDALSRVLGRIETSANADDHLARLLAPTAAGIPWYLSLYCNIRELIKPEKLPPLVLTSKPVAVKSIWGLYAKNPKSRYISVAAHAAIFALLMVTFTNRAVQQKLAERLNLIDPNIEPYKPLTPKRAGGGGGAREIAPVTKGQAPKPALKQFTPSMLVQQPPRLAMMPTIVAPPDTVFPGE